MIKKTIAKFIVVIVLTTPAFAELPVIDGLTHGWLNLQDLNRAFEHVETLGQWAEQIQKATETVQNTATAVKQGQDMLTRVGDPQQAAGLISGLTGNWEGLNTLSSGLDLEGIRGSADGASALLSSGQGLYEAIGDAVDIGGGQSASRDVSRYARFDLIEKLFDAFTKSSKDYKEAQKKETELQQDLQSKLQTAKDQAEVDRIHAAMTASNGRLAALEAEMARRKAEFDTAKQANENQKDKEETAARENDELIGANTIDQMNAASDEGIEKMSSTYDNKVTVPYVPLVAEPMQLDDSSR